MRREEEEDNDRAEAPRAEVKTASKRRRKASDAFPGCTAAPSVESPSSNDEA